MWRNYGYKLQVDILVAHKVRQNKSKDEIQKPKKIFAKKMSSSSMAN